MDKLLSPALSGKINSSNDFYVNFLHSFYITVQLIILMFLVFSDYVYIYYCYIRNKLKEAAKVCHFVKIREQRKHPS